MQENLVTPPPSASALEQAEGYMMLELFDDAWLALQQLSPSEAALPAALRVKMCTATGLGKWDAAHDIAQALRHGDSSQRLAAACCFHHLAAKFYKDDRIDDAAQMIVEAIHTRPEQRHLILSDPRFPHHFLARWNGGAPNALPS